uniref:Alpha-type protein kinase domain-containing protein n=1 Tax=Chaetoceros debilis TaxID=122233 RepID=A0A7S3V8N3_9STRA
MSTRAMNRRSPPPSPPPANRLRSRGGGTGFRSPSSSSTSTGMGRTSAITLLDTNHGRERRLQRNIPLRDIQAAIKHGKKERHPSNRNLIIYTYQGQKHIISEDESRRLVTTMVSTIDLQLKYISTQEGAHHRRAQGIICDENSKIPWKSHSILIVDKSGSMRNSDVSGCRTRLGAVWLSIAQDFINFRLEAGTASDMDVVTIILMGEDAKVLVDRHPTNKLLFNRVVEYFHDSEEADREWHRNRGGKKGRNGKRQRGPRPNMRPGFVQPGGHGFYGPSLKKAEDLLEQYDDGHAESALHVLLLSDGRPSDHTFILRDMNDNRKKSKNNKDQICRKTMKEEQDEIEEVYKNVRSTLQKAVERMASKHGRRFNFAAIGMGNMKEYECLKELVSSANDFGGQANFQVPGLSCAEIGAAVSSAATSLTACQTALRSATNIGGQQQRRVRQCLRENSRLLPALTEVVDDTFDIYMNEDVERDEYKDGKFVKVDLRDADAKGVALKQLAFGEGQERLAFQFFELGDDGSTVVGEALVAKESRFIESETDTLGRSNNWLSRDKFVKRFCKLHATAQICAKAFNQKLDSIPNLDLDTARVSFIDCCVYYLNHKTRGQFAVIVEPRLDGKFEKWNNNNGWQMKTSQKDRREIATLPEQENEDEDDDVIDLTGFDKDSIFVSNNEVAQAFSHFSYIHSGRKRLICDLQGVMKKQSKLFCFTDPAIHYHNAREEEGSNLTKYGRTDRGQKGIQNFFDSHTCNGLCNLVTKGFINAD